MSIHTNPHFYYIIEDICLVLIILQGSDTVSIHMAAHVNCHRQTCNVSRVYINIYCQCCHCSSQTARTDPCSIDSLQQFFLHFLYIRDIRMLIHRTRQCFLGKLRALFKGSSNSYSHNHRWAGIRAGIFHSR